MNVYKLFLKFIGYRTPATMPESLTDLPPNILSEILSRLPIKSLFVCRSVCKTFLNLTSSNPHFNALHFSKTAQNLIIQFGSSYQPTRLVHLVDSELDTAFGFRLKVNVKEKAMFQIPKFPAKYFEEYRMYIGDENNFVLVNSCNGLLYFAERSVCERSFICNPITNEYVTLLEYDVEKNLTMGLWFGFSPEENLYKVLRIFATVSGTPSQDGFKMEYWAQVHVGSSISMKKNSEIAPPLDFGLEQQMNKHGMSIGVLGGYLCLSDDTWDLDIWVMKKFGGQDCWSKEFVVDTSIHMDKPLEGPFRPLQILSDGKILMIWANRVLVTYDPKTKDFGYLEFDGVESLGKVVLYTPSFFPLKDALMVDNLTVQNMTSRENPGLIE
ncbi:hypothetical protein DH2020_028773 [Rehmannia glutinosa]|uniref:F-box domain-containing protein n=1 Tax=Rehmannia glutinosa TaxID=99300 RepID=A0ABR0VT90_REHGL